MGTGRGGALRRVSWALASAFAAVSLAGCIVTEQQAADMTDGRPASQRQADVPHGWSIGK